MACQLNIEIPLLKVQEEFLRSTEDFVAIVSSRSCGKTFAAILDSLTHVMQGENVLYYSPTEGSWYRGPWIHLQTLLRKFGLEREFRWNGSLRQGTLFGKTLFVGTYENPDSGRGATECGTLMLDEFQLSKPNILATVAPCLRGTDKFGRPINPRIRAVGTPDMRSAWQLMLVEPQKYGLRILRSKMTENVFMTDKQRAVMANAIFDEKLRRQEIEGEIIIGEDASSIIKLSDFGIVTPPCGDMSVYAGLDMAHTGIRDGHVFSAIRGNELLALHKFGMASHEQVASWIRKFHHKYPISALNMDLAWSESVYDQLKYEIRCFQRAFGGAAPEGQTLAYGNFRGWGYFHAANLVKSGLNVNCSNEFIDADEVPMLKKEMCNTHFTLDRLGRLLIEPKDNIKERLGHSPDSADSFVLACSGRDLNTEAPHLVAVTNAQLTARETDDILSEFEE